jgi:hypothetical protein
MPLGFFVVARLNGAGCTGRPVEPFRLVAAKKNKADALKLGNAGHWYAPPEILTRMPPALTGFLSGKAY